MKITRKYCKERDLIMTACTAIPPAIAKIKTSRKRINSIIFVGTVVFSICLFVLLEFISQPIRVILQKVSFRFIVDELQNFYFNDRRSKIVLFFYRFCFQFSLLILKSVVGFSTLFCQSTIIQCNFDIAYSLLPGDSFINRWVLTKQLDLREDLFKSQVWPFLLCLLIIQPSWM